MFIRFLKIITKNRIKIIKIEFLYGFLNGLLQNRFFSFDFFKESILMF